jgi:hypothetical protein
MRPFDTSSPALQELPWPPVNRFADFGAPLGGFLDLPADAQRAKLHRLRQTPERHGRFLHRSLASVYAYVLGYPDSPCFRRLDDALEGKLQQAKIVLERELLDGWLVPAATPPFRDRAEAMAHLRGLAGDNPGYHHPLFDYVRAAASRRALELFLWNEVVRNEVVDDEVALLVCGLQGVLKSACATNLWDEVGRGKLKNFHTYWLRRLLGGPAGWERLTRYRRQGRPWYAGVTSNVFMMLLTRPGAKLAALGHFLVTEGWVVPHFQKVLAGMERTGLRTPDRDVYFSAHVLIDPTHTEELLTAVERQVPALSAGEIGQIVGGASLAVAGATAQYDRMLGHLKEVDAE